MFTCNHAEWTHTRNIKQIYDVVYNEMVDAEIAIAREKHVFTDHKGKEVDENERCGLVQNILIRKPKYLIFTNESGFNTSQKNDGRIGGAKHIVECGTVPQKVAFATNHRFTMLPFTSGSSYAMYCVFIFKTETEQIP